MKTRRLVWFGVLVVMVLWTSLGWAEQPRYGGTLRSAWPGDPAFFNTSQGPAQGAPAAWLVHNFEMQVASFANLVDINQRSVSFFKGRQSDYVGIDDPPLEEMVHQWRRALEPEKRKAISADMQRRLADQLEWVNLTTYPYFEAYRQNVKNFPFYNQAYQFFDTTWLAP